MARRHHVVSVLVDQMSAFEPAVADEVFGEDWSEVAGRPWYRLTHCSASGPKVRLGGMTVLVEHGLEAVARADTVLIPGWCGVRTGAAPELLDALRRADARGARIASFCTGAFALGEAGVLDGLRATTHWHWSDQFRSRFPAVELDPAVLYVDNGRVLTSAGAAGAIDLAMHLVRNDYGVETANAIARQLVIPPHRSGGQAQYIETPIAPGPTTGDDITEALAWAVAHLDEALTVADLAAVAHMSPRHFARQFRAATGTTPHQWLLTQRLGLAQRLLETTDLPVEHVATASGFGTAGALRLHFQRTLQTNPVAYRRTFRDYAAVEVPASA
ncbi:MAG: GlxA family transcriptional regulator [Acidimicrobiia bacterium]